MADENTPSIVADTSVDLNILNNEKLTKLKISDAFSVDPAILQTITGIVADKGIERIILADDPKIIKSLDVFDVQQAIEEVIWNDVEGLPMVNRLGIHASPPIDDHVDAALNSNVRYFESSKQEFQQLKDILDARGEKYTVE